MAAWRLSAPSQLLADLLWTFSQHFPEQAPVGTPRSSAHRTMDFRMRTSSLGLIKMSLRSLPVYVALALIRRITSASEQRQISGNRRSLPLSQA